MTREMREALAKEIAFLAVATKERQFELFYAAPSCKQEELDEFSSFFKAAVLSYRMVHGYQDMDGEKEE